MGDPGTGTSTLIKCAKWCSHNGGAAKKRETGPNGLASHGMASSIYIYKIIKITSPEITPVDTLSCDVAVTDSFSEKKGVLKEKVPPR